MMANVNCCLCLNDCTPENILKVYDHKLDVNLPQLIAKYLFIVLEDNDDTNNDANICRMCFVHLLDFHYFFKLVEQKQQERDLFCTKNQISTIELTDSEFEGDDICFLDDILKPEVSECCEESFHVVNEADDSCSVDTIKESNKRNSAILKRESLEDRFVYDDDSEPCTQAASSTETNSEANGNLAKKRKLSKDNDTNQNASINETLIRLRRRTKNIYDVVDSHGHLIQTEDQTEGSDTSESYIKKHRKKRGRPRVRPAVSSTKTTETPPTEARDQSTGSGIRGTRSDVITNAIIANIGQLKCDYCEIVSKNFRDLVHHFRKKHRQVRRPYVVCCNKRHYSPKTLANHILSHSNPELFKCEICDKVLGTQYSYLQHKRTKHSGKREVFKCNICGKRLVSAKYFDVHVSNHN